MLIFLIEKVLHLLPNSQSGVTTELEEGNSGGNRNTVRRAWVVCPGERLWLYTAGKSFVMMG